MYKLIYFIAITFLFACNVKANLQTPPPNKNVTNIALPAISFKIDTIAANGIMNMEVYSTKKQTTILRIINTKKDIVLVQQENLNKGANRIELDLSFLPKGSYMMKISTEKESVEQVFER